MQGPTIAQVYLVAGTLIFLALDGHLMLIATVAESFRLLPMGSTLELDNLVAIAHFGSAMFAGAVLIAIPATAALLTVNITVGVLTRAVPQFNMFVAFPGILLLGLIAISLTLSGLVPHLGGLFEEATGLARRILVAR
jgi:flagellar biosynthetic protein FliR